MKNNPLTKPLTLIDDQLMAATADRLGIKIEIPIDNDRRLRAENFASRIIAMLSRVEDRNNMGQVYSVLATFAYGADAEIISHTES